MRGSKRLWELWPTNLFGVNLRVCRVRPPFIDLCRRDAATGAEASHAQHKDGDGVEGEEIEEEEGADSAQAV
eukprot:4109375-Amphidinium_carterae.2